MKPRERQFFTYLCYLSVYVYVHVSASVSVYVLVYVSVYVSVRTVRTMMLFKKLHYKTEIHRTVVYAFAEIQNPKHMPQNMIFLSG